MKRIVLECDDLDYDAINRVFARHQQMHSLPDGDGNMAGRLVAEICRGWEELVDFRSHVSERPNHSDPIGTQVGGSHYKGMAIQPVEYVHANGIGYFEGNVIKYVSRWRQKNGIEDLRKAVHFLQLLIMFEEGVKK